MASINVRPYPQPGGKELRENVRYSLIWEMCFSCKKYNLHLLLAQVMLLACEVICTRSEQIVSREVLHIKRLIVNFEAFLI